MTIMEKNIDKNTQSLFRTAETISGSFLKLRFVTIACIACTFATVVFGIGYSLHAINEVTGKVYVIDRGQVALASRVDAAVTRRDEIENLSCAFHQLLFNVSPVEAVVKSNLDEALSFTSDRSVYNYYNDLQESGFYQRIRQANAVQEVVVDSVQVNTSLYPYQVQTFSTLYLLRESMLIRSSLVTRMNMIEVARDAHNLNGLKIGEFFVVRNDEIDRRKR